MVVFPSITHGRPSASAACHAVGGRQNHPTAPRGTGPTRRSARQLPRGAGGGPASHIWSVKLQVSRGRWQTVSMTGSDPKADLHRYLQDARAALLGKLDRLSEYDVRRPMVPTGTNLLGLIKHAASVELGYFRDPFDRTFTHHTPCLTPSTSPTPTM